MNKRTQLEVERMCGPPEEWEQRCPNFDNWLSDAVSNCGTQD